MFGGKVNETTGGNVCTNVSGDVCTKGSVGTGPGEFSTPSFTNFIDVGPGGTIFVGDKERIQEFNPDGSFKGEIQLPGETVRSLAVDPAGNLYVARVGDSPLTISPSKPDVLKLSSTGTELCTLKVPDPRAIATDPAGNVFVANEGKGVEVGGEVIEFDASCKPTIELPDAFGQREGDSTSLNGLATNGACANGVAVSVSRFNGFSKSYVSVFGPPPDPDVCPPPLVPPTISSQHVTKVDTESAIVGARINPHFWSDTSYYVEYGTGECAAGGCDEEAPVPPNVLGSEASSAVSAAGIPLADLSEDTTYHYRLVAVSSGGGPVFGIDPDGEAEGEEASFEEGLEGTFTTRRKDPGPEPTCANDDSRIGVGGSLPDCRAYEMVSPIEKNQGDIVVACAGGCDIQQGTPGGGKLTYSSYRAFGEVEGAPLVNQYIATRIAGKEWTSESISPPREGASVYSAVGLQTQYKVFSEDLCKGWLLYDSRLALAPGALVGFGGLYRRESCGAGAKFELVSQIDAGFTPPNEYVPKVQGVSANGTSTVFRADGQLNEEASANTGIFQLYLHVVGRPGLRLVSRLPSGSVNETNSAAGTDQGTKADHRQDSIHNAISEDGKRIYWTATGFTNGQGTLYLRINADQEQSAMEGGECSEAGKGCTLPVSGLVSSSAAQFWGASQDGSRAIFSVGGKLYEFSYVGGEAKTALIADQSVGVAGMSENASRLYFASREAIGGEGTAGEPNLYLYEAPASEGAEPSYSLVATLAAADVSADFPFFDVNPQPSGSTNQGRSTRISPDGEHLAFMSTRSLTDYDNDDAETGEPASEVFLYDAESDKVICASCDPSGGQPVGRSFSIKAGTSIRVAARIPTWESAFYPSRALSGDGNRLFFESFTPLISRDTNNRTDVYEWEALGTGGCKEDRAAFSSSSGGCIYLISSGESSSDSEFVDASTSGNDVFFKTAQSILPQDPGLVDIYDARVGGGLPVPPPSQPGCEGSACQTPAVPPSDPGPASLGYHGPGNETAKKPPACPKGKHQVKKGGKHRCVKNKKKKAKGGKSGRAGR
ncbi:MAG TPA: hypothetical protein VFI03_01050 [Solirubrobacterales bacterium]|nr:hypothetical protein [Solirubrobacterales bacterium]